MKNFLTNTLVAVMVTIVFLWPLIGGVLFRPENLRAIGLANIVWAFALSVVIAQSSSPKNRR